jgi:hypothetical protein
MNECAILDPCFRSTDQRIFCRSSEPITGYQGSQALLHACDGGIPSRGDICADRTKSHRKKSLQQTISKAPPRARRISCIKTPILRPDFCSTRAVPVDIG